jgi:hypothetical protein
MTEPVSILILSAAGLIALAMLSAAGLVGWRGWLELQKLHLAGVRDLAVPPPAGARIEIADLKERIRKLEAIAAGIDL